MILLQSTIIFFKKKFVVLKNVMTVDRQNTSRIETKKICSRRSLLSQRMPPLNKFCSGCIAIPELGQRLALMETLLRKEGVRAAPKPQFWPKRGSDQHCLSARLTSSCVILLWAIVRQPSLSTRGWLLAPSSRLFHAAFRGFEKKTHTQKKKQQRRIVLRQPLAPVLEGHVHDTTCYHFRRHHLHVYDRFTPEEV